MSRLTTNEIVEAVRDEYPKFDKTLLSKTRHPAAYGVQLVKGAEAIVKSLSGAQGGKTEKRKKIHAHRFRLTPKQETVLQRCVSASRHSTVQGFIENLINEEAKRLGL